MKTFLLLALLASAAAPVAAHADDAKPIKLRMATVAPKGTPWSKLLKNYKKKVKKKTKATSQQVKVKVYLGGVKGDEQSSVRQVFKGSLEGAGVSTAAVSAVVPSMDILEMPYLFDSYEEADKVLEAVRGEVNAALASKGMMLLMYSENGYRSFGWKREDNDQPKFIKKPGDLANVKMRSQESQVHLAMYRALGASPVSISVGEVLSSLQTGVVDGFDNTPLFTQAASWNQAITHYSVSKHIYQPALIIVNKAWWDGLPEDVRAVLKAESKKLEPKGRKLVRALNPALLENLRASGVKVYELSDAERAVFKKATRGGWAARRAAAVKAGDTDGVALYDAVMKAKGL
jgi:TRAP-type C4-dicarboxylate transport system substrate-binding protein